MQNTTRLLTFAGTKLIRTSFQENKKTQKRFVYLQVSYSILFDSFVFLVVVVLGFAFSKEYFRVGRIWRFYINKNNMKSNVRTTVVIFIFLNEILLAI